MLLICGGAGGQAGGMGSALLSGWVLVCAGRPALSRCAIGSGDEMIDRVLSPRRVAAARSTNSAQRSSDGP
jgi:hypothetical protein